MFAGVMDIQNVFALWWVAHRADDPNSPRGIGCPKQKTRHAEHVHRTTVVSVTTRDRDSASLEADVALIIDHLGVHAEAVIDMITDRLVAEISELSGDLQPRELLRASTAGNVETVLDALRYNISIERVEPPTAALEYARRLAQNGTPVTALVRAYRLGHQVMLSQVYAEIRRGDLSAADALVTYEQISGVTFRYIDWISQQVIATYEAEREQWLNNRNSIRAIRVRELLATDEDADVDAAATAIRYPLRHVHLALVLWLNGNVSPGGELMRLERFISHLAGALELPTAPLFVPADRASGWAWFALPGNAIDGVEQRIRLLVEQSDDAPSVALGTPQAGLSGFRRSHQHAQLAYRVAQLGSRSHCVIAAGDPGVGAAALLTENIAQTRRWIDDTLGPLAANTVNDARLRETLRVFLLEGSSYKAASEQLNLHHNSVRYRVQRAVERRGRPIADDRLDVELALSVRHLLGDPPPT